MSDYDDDTPGELLLRELSNSPAWREVQNRLIYLRDLHVASMISMKPDASAGAIQRELGYIHALNTITKTPDDLLKKASARIKETK